ncbi:hypothetical protein HI914_04010 [Erysiphe necator]|nr:hypothetical protein HI914_04010 [Erysiphe necator]
MSKEIKDYIIVIHIHDKVIMHRHRQCLSIIGNWKIHTAQIFRHVGLNLGNSSDLATMLASV